MASENAREELRNGYLFAETGLNNERIKNWVSFESDNENRGSLAAIVFYGACIRECMTQGIDNPLQAHWVALALLSAIGEDNIEKILFYMVGHPLPPEVKAGINHYKENMQSEVGEALTMIDNFKVEVNIGGVKVIVGPDGILDDAFDEDLEDEIIEDFDEDE